MLLLLSVAGTESGRLLVGDFESSKRLSPYGKGNFMYRIMIGTPFKSAAYCGSSTDTQTGRVVVSGPDSGTLLLIAKAIIVLYARI
jgi:hypothetical protein